MVVNVRKQYFKPTRSIRNIGILPNILPWLGRIKNRVVKKKEKRITKVYKKELDNEVEKENQEALGDTHPTLFSIK